MKRWLVYSVLFAGIFTAAWTYNVRTEPERRRRAMSKALFENDVALVHRLLDQGVDPLFQTEGGASPLSLFTESKDYEGIERVLRAGADPNTFGPKYGSMLHIAVENFDLRAAKTLLKAGANPNSTLGNVDPPLLLVFHGGRTEEERIALVRLLCDYGADIDARVSYLGTALRAAVVYDEPKIVRYLLEKGANPRIAPPDHGDSPMTVALGNGYGRKPHLVRLLTTALSKQVPPRRRIFDALARSDEQALISCISEGIDVDTRDSTGRTLLHAAIEKGDLAHIRVLLQRNADIEARNKASLTPLMAAAKRRNLPLIQLLLALGATVTAKDAKGRTAVRFAYPGTETARLLMAAERAAGVKPGASK